MKKLNKLSVALSAIVGVAAPLMMSGNFVSADANTEKETENKVTVETNSQTDILELVQVPNVNFPAVSATELYTKLDLENMPITTDLIVNDGRSDAGAIGWTLQGKLGQFIRPADDPKPAATLSSTTLKFTNVTNTGNEQGGINFVDSLLTSGGTEFVNLIKFDQRGTKSILKGDIKVALENPGTPDISVDDGDEFTAVLDWNLAQGILTRSL